MFCKQILALFLWCHCYHIVLFPFLHLLSVINSGQNIQPHLWPSAFQQVEGLNSLLPGHSASLVSESQISADAEQRILTPGVDIVLKCSDYPNEQFYWTRYKLQPNNKDSTPTDRIEETLSPSNKFIINNNVITIKSPQLTDVGDYYCRFKNSQDMMDTVKMYAIRARPSILDFDIEPNTSNSAVVEEGRPLKLLCNVKDDYSPESNLKISWLMSKFDENDMKDVISGEDGIKIEVYNSTSQALIIDYITKDHRRFYKCQVFNGITDYSKVIRIRVKDVYRIIWPTIGIVIELVILIGVICVVESRKVEPDVDTYDRKAIQM